MSQNHENLNLFQAANPKADIRLRPIAGNGIGVVPEISPEDTQGILREREAAYIALMDQMEASVPENGQFFIKIGEKPTGPKRNDSRVLIFKEGRTHEGTWGVIHAAIIRGGPRKIQIQPKEWAKLSNPFHKPSRQSSGLISDKPGNRYVNLGGFRRTLRMILPIAGAEDEKFVEEAMTKSIDLSRREMQKRKEMSKQEQARIKRLSDLLNHSVQSSNGTGPAIPPLR